MVYFFQVEQPHLIGREIEEKNGFQKFRRKKHFRRFRLLQWVLIIGIYQSKILRPLAGSLWHNSSAFVFCSYHCCVHVAKQLAVMSAIKRLAGVGHVYVYVSAKKIKKFDLYSKICNTCWNYYVSRIIVFLTDKRTWPEAIHSVVLTLSAPMRIPLPWGF